MPIKFTIQAGVKRGQDEPFPGSTLSYLKHFILKKLCNISPEDVSIGGINLGGDAVLTMGPEAMAFYMPNKENRLTEYHGHIHWRDGRLVGHTFHPSIALADMNYLPVIVQEINNFVRAVDNPDVLTRPKVIKKLPNFCPIKAAIDFEWDVESDKVTVVGMAPDPVSAYSSNDVERGMALVEEMLEKGYTVVGHNLIQAELLKTQRRPQSFGLRHCVDTLVLSHLAYPHLAGLGIYDLGSMVRMSMPCIDWKHDQYDLLTYNAYDCAYTARLEKVLMKDIEALKCTHLIEPDQELRYLTQRMKEEGVRIDRKKLREALNGFVERKSALIAKLPFNPNSPRQVISYFERNKVQLESLKFEDVERAAKKYPKNEELQLLREYREDMKSIQTWFECETDENGYYKNAPEYLYPTFNSLGTSVARLSSAGPNFQNLPPNLRHLILPHPGEILVAFDANQIEARIVAFEAREDQLLKAFASGVDIHSQNAANMSRAAGFEVSRQDGKITSHASNYGESAYNLARRLFGNVRRESIKQATLLQEAYFGAYPRIRQWQRTIQSRIMSGDILLRNVFGRPRLIYVHEEAEALKKGCHYLGCSGAADFVNRCALKIWRQTALVPLLIVHDELCYSVPEGMLKMMKDIKAEILEAPCEQLDGMVIPWKMKAGPNYGELHEVVEQSAVGAIHSSGSPHRV